MRKIQNAISDAVDVDVAIEDLGKSIKIAIIGWHYGPNWRQQLPMHKG
jgi:hypothetical protein